MEISTLILSFLIILAAAIIIFLLLRQPVLWYFRINEMVENQYKVISLLSKIAGEQPGDKEK